MSEATFDNSAQLTGEGKPRVVWAMWQQQREDLKAVATACHQAGIEDFRAGVGAAHAELIAGVFHKVFADPELGLAPEQRDAALMVAGRHLRQVAEGDGMDG